MASILPAGAGDEPDGPDIDAAWDLSGRRPTGRADFAADRIVFEGALPFGVRWLFARSLRRRDRQTERTLRFMVLLLVAIMVCGLTTVLAVVALSA